jgi:uncharacterized protein with PIN domain
MQFRPEHMSNKRPFPRYASHDDVVCFNCNAPVNRSRCETSDYPEGKGKYMFRCAKCEHKTWYDIAEPQQA